MNEIPKPHELCHNVLEDFSLQERANNCPFCLTRNVQCQGNFHPRRTEQPPSVRKRTWIEWFLGKSNNANDIDGTYVSVFLFHCRLHDACNFKFFRANIFKLAEENFAVIRSSVANDGIRCDCSDIIVDLVFENKTSLYSFQNELRRCVDISSFNKKRKTNDTPQSSPNVSVVESETYESNSVPAATIEDEEISTIYIKKSVVLQRVFYISYSQNNDESSFNFPICDTVSYAGSLSIYEPENATVSIETVGQMIENVNSPFFTGKKLEVAHIKDKGKLPSFAKKDENNRLCLSRFLHEAFDGIGTDPPKFPWFVIHYVSHTDVATDHAGLQRLFPEVLQCFDSTKMYYCTIVHIEFFNLQMANLYSPCLRNFTFVEEGNPLKIQMELFFPDPNKAKIYLQWKEKKTREIWA